MPALFSFLGGIANGYNESKAAEAKALQEERLENKKFEGRMKIAKYEAAAAQERTRDKTILDNLYRVMYNGELSEEMRADARRGIEKYLSDNPAARIIAAQINQTVREASVGGAGQDISGGLSGLPEDVPPPDTRSKRVEVP
jgi:hypothetical protein